MNGKTRHGSVVGKKKMVVRMALAVMLTTSLLFLLWPGVVRAGTNYIVSNTADSGEGSLREAILEANANPNQGTDKDSIIFAIEGDGPFTIQPSTPLPAITGPVTINGYSQEGSEEAIWSTPATLMIEISGALAGVASGLDFASGSAGSVVKGLVINSFKNNGISIEANNITVEGNHIGTNVSGTAAVGNYYHGVAIASTGNTIGGDTAAKRNVISGNTLDGVCIFKGSANVQGNYIGTNASGTAAMGNNEYGVYICVSTGNTIGGDTAARRNVISGNGDYGVYISGGSTNNVQGNYIGTNVSGTAAVKNTNEGVYIDSSTGNTIGGWAAGQPNLISGNGTNGVCIEGGSTNNLQGNYIGTNWNGTAAVGNTMDGVSVVNSTGNTVGGDTAAKRNVISGNSGDGVRVISGSSNNIQGNYIGTNAGGTAAVGNTYDGVRFDSTTGNTIGGDTAAKRNVISGNGSDGVLFDASSNNNYIQGNYIGTNASGTAAVGNTFDGVYINYSTGNSIGGDTTTKRNVISGNGRYGVYIATDSTNTNVQGNYIGTNASGSAAMGNTGCGVVANSCSGITVGGDTAAKRNVISGNGGNGGIQISHASGDNIQGNYIGTDASGTAGLGNTSHGVYCWIATDCDVTGNRIWNNSKAGVFLQDKDAYGIRISQNSLYGNGWSGIDLNGVTGNNGLNNETDQPNKGYDFPVFSAAQYTVLDGAGNISGTAPPNAWVELYKTGPTPDPSGNGEGLTYLATVQANGGGAFSAALTGLAHGDHISALAISPVGDASGEGNTSEFSANALIQAQYTITATAGAGGSIDPSGAVTVDHGSNQTFTITPKAGYYIDDVLVNGSSVGPVGGYTFESVLEAGHSIEARFALKPAVITSLSPKSGIAGTVIIINGTGFGAKRGTSYVSFGGVKATSYVSWSATRIKVKVPAGAAGAVNLKIITGGGRSNLKPYKVTPRITKMTPKTGPAGTAVTITGTGFGAKRGTSTVKFGKTAVTKYVSWSNTKIECKVPATGAGAKLVKVTTSGGTSGGMNFTVK